MHALALDSTHPAIILTARRGVGARRTCGVNPSPAPGSQPPGLGAGASALIRAIADRGDREAFALLFNHFAPRVKGYLLRMGTDSEVAEDLAQETLLTVWRRAASFDPARAAASTWIFTIARNLRVDVARRERRPLPGEDWAEARQGPMRPDAGLAAVQEELRVATAIATLPAEQLQVVRLAFFSDKPHSEIASDLSLPLGTVKSRLRLAMAKLRALLEDAP